MVEFLILAYCIGAFYCTYTYDKKLTQMKLPKPPIKVKVLLGITWPVILYRYWQLRRKRKQ